MEQLMLSQKIQQIIHKYKYAAVILVIGLVLMLLPQQTDIAEETEKAEPAPVVTDDLQSQLEDLLGQIQGAGDVRVLLTMETEKETVYQTDAGASGADTVIVEDSANSESALVRTVQSPVYRGAVVVCQGADSAVVRLAIIEAVSCATGLRSDQISVVKMN